jgi:hypothetical protein
MEVRIKWEPQERQLVALKACGLSAPFQQNIKLRPSGTKGEPFRPAVADIVGYGGSAGGGKTDLMVAAALIAMAAYPGINIGYFRRKYPQLTGLGGAIARSKSIFPSNEAVCKYNETSHVWAFTNGSHMQFCHCNNPNDVESYQSQQFDIMMIDETTQFLEMMVKFLLTRNRATVTNPNFRSFAIFATNPGSVGHLYFKTEFVDIGEPETLHDFKNETGQIEKHIFIPSKLADNKILLDRDPNYAVKLSPNEAIRKRLLEGEWDIFEGQVFGEFRRGTHVMRPIMPNLKFSHYLSMDWGYSALSAYAAYAHVLLHQKTADGVNFNRIITYREWYGNMKAPDVWAELIYKQSSVKYIRGYVDPAMTNTQTDGSTPIAELFENKWKQINGGENWLNLEKGINDRPLRQATLHNWLQIAPDGLPYWMCTENCTNLIRTLPQLVYDDTKIDEVDTTLEDHCLLATTKIITYNGIKQIKDLVGTTGKVLSINGKWIDYSHCRKTRENAVLVEVIFSDGSNLICTPDHKILTSQGMIQAVDLENQECILSVKNVKNLMERNTTCADIITLDKLMDKNQSDYIGKCGSILMAKFLMVIMSIIKILIDPIIILKTWAVNLVITIYHFMVKMPIMINGSSLCTLGLVNGMEQIRAENGINNTTNNSKIDYIKSMKSYVLYVKNCLKQKNIMLNSAQEIAHHNIDEIPESMIFWSNVQGANKVIKEINTARVCAVRDNAVIKCVEVKKLDYRADTYCLRAKDYHLFSLANGVLVSNSYDSLTYFLDMIKFINVSAGAFNYNAGKPALVTLPYNKEGEPLSLDPKAFMEAAEEANTSAEWTWAH